MRIRGNRVYWGQAGDQRGVLFSARPAALPGQTAVLLRAAVAAVSDRGAGRRGARPLAPARGGFGPALAGHGTDPPATERTAPFESLAVAVATLASFAGYGITLEALWATS